MDLTGERIIPAPRQAVWDALNDVDVLRQAIPGCDAIERTSDTELTARVTAKVGPVKAKFAGAVTLSNVDAPNGYTISGEGKGGAAGFAKGSADVRLDDHADGTRLSYAVKASVGGKLAQVGSRLIDGTARKLSDEFFDAFAAQVAERAGPAEAPTAAPAEPAPAEPAPAEPAPAAEPEPGEPLRGLHPVVWLGGLVVVVVVALLLISGLD